MKSTSTTIILSLIGLAASQAATISWSSTPYTVNGGFGQFLNTGLFVTTGTEILTFMRRAVDELGAGVSP